MSCICNYLLFLDFKTIIDMFTKKIFIIILFLSVGFLANAQLIVTSGAGTTPQQLVQNVLVGNGVTVSNVKFNGSTAALAGSMMGSFTTGTTATNLGINSGLLIASGGVAGSIGPNGSPSTTTPTGTTNISDPQLQALIPGYTINDAAVLEFDFVPLADTLRFRYVFGSEEYPEFVSTSFNDVFGFFVTGLNPYGASYSNKNIALIPNTILPVTIDNVNQNVNTQYYVTNTGGATIQYDGFTTVLTAWILVIPCTQYHIKIAVSDAGDSAYDSGVFLEANSFTSQGVTVNTIYSQPGVANNAIEGCNNAIIGFKLPYVTAYNYQIPIISIGGTATNGIDYPNLPSMVIIPAGTDSTTLIISPNLDGISEGNETIKLIIQTSACGYDTININIQDYTQLNAIAYGDTVVCGGSVPIKVIAQNGIAPYQYTWSNALPATANVIATPTGTTMYYISVKDACQNIVNDSVFVEINCTFADAGPDTTICLGGTATLTASGGPFFLWSTGDTTAVINVNPTITTSYIVTVTDVFSDSDTVTVFVNPLPIIVATSNPATICPGESSQLLATGAQTYQWTSNPVDNSLNGQQALDNPLVTPSTTTIYTVVGKDSNTCVNSATIAVNTSPLPSPHIFASPNPVSIFSPIVHLFDGNSTSTTWYWDLGDGTTSTQDNFYHTFSDQDTGRYLVTLIVSNVHGCIDSTQEWVIVRPDGTYYVPNSFTPNGDGKNDVFKVYGMGTQDFEIYIYDRWGKLVYTSKDMNEGWNGKLNDKELPDGIYNYVVIQKDVMGIRHTKPGSVTLIR